MRLDKFLSEAGAASRRELKQIVKSGRVTVNGAAVRDPAAQIDPLAQIALDGSVIEAANAVILMLNKPAGYLTATEDAECKTVMELIPEAYRKRGVKPAGRLDKETEGLLLFTNDGDLAHRLIAPKSEIVKTYYAEHEGTATQEDIRLFRDGLTLRDGTVCKSAELIPLGNDSSLIRVSEGKYHQVRRMMASRSMHVTYLRRIAIGSLELGDLPLGEVREVTKEEISPLL
ncbi:MAG: rRNA pseudouridine synthase [Oscillospiraceae bacterium]|nr:rRNA pseudouridine synthase [Oscillospiraceae bacterium]